MAVRKRVYLPRPVVMTLEVGLRCGSKQVKRKLVLPYPTKLYEFELGRTLSNFIIAFKNVSGAIKKSEQEISNRFNRAIVLKRRRDSRRKRAR